MRIDCNICDMIRNVVADLADRTYSDFYVSDTKYFMITKFDDKWHINTKRHIQYFIQLSQDETYDLQLAIGRVIQEVRGSITIKIDQMALPQDGAKGHLTVIIEPRLPTTPKGDK